MTFCEPLFLFFFLPALVSIYHLAAERFRNLLLTVASLAFYAVGEWRFLGWLVASIAANYVLARLIQHERGTERGRAFLTVGIASDLALLVVFKYAGFLVENLNLLLGDHKVSVPHLALPLGISFFTFHKISYKIDVWRGDAEARKNPWDLTLYILLFPQLVAGPIVRYHDIAKELRQRRSSFDEVGLGVVRFSWGLAKKMLIANTLAGVADHLFGGEVVLTRFSGHLVYAARAAAG